MMKFTSTLIFIFPLILSAQNDLDAIRYSRGGTNGTSRFAAMGGAFGALGADLSCAANNPAGLAVFRKNEVAVGFGLRITNNEGLTGGASSSMTDAKFVFNNLGYLASWPTKADPESRHSIAFTNTQLQNFSNKVSFSNYTNSNSIAKDMLNIAQSRRSPSNLNFGYEGAAYNVFVLDTFEGKFFSFVDLKRTVLQTRQINTSGRVNELNFSYAYAFKDQLYLGASLGVPLVQYTSTTSHNENDDKDSMQVIVHPDNSVSTTYIDGLPTYYPAFLGFNSLSYTEYFTTSGSGVNLKIGGILRLNDFVRVGFHYHSPTLFSLTDNYYYAMSATFDKDKRTPVESKFPENGGLFKYKIITTSRFGLSTALIVKRLAAIGLDYELTNYRDAQLSSSNASDFAGVNSVIKNKYSFASNARLGVEFNLRPVMLRTGYVMQGSPFGNAFTGSFVRHTFSLGFGLRTKNNFFWDFVWHKTVSSEDYFMFSTLSNKSQINYNNSMLAATVGVKF